MMMKFKFYLIHIDFVLCKFSAFSFLLPSLCERAISTNSVNGLSIKPYVAEILSINPVNFQVETSSFPPKLIIFGESTEIGLFRFPTLTEFIAEKSLIFPITLPFLYAAPLIFIESKKMQQ